MRFLLALLLCWFLSPVGANALEGKSPAPAKKPTYTLVSADLHKLGLPLKKGVALSREFTDEIDVIQQHFHPTIIANYCETHKPKFCTLNFSHKILETFCGKTKFYEQYILGCLYPKHTFW